MSLAQAFSATEDAHAEMYGDPDKVSEGLKISGPYETELLARAEAIHLNSIIDKKIEEALFAVVELPSVTELAMIEERNKWRIDARVNDEDIVVARGRSWPKSHELHPEIFNIAREIIRDLGEGQIIEPSATRGK